MLHRRQCGADRGQFLRLQIGYQHTQHAVEFVHTAHGFDARVILVDASSVGQAGLALVAGSRIEFAQAKAHGVMPCGESR